MVSAFMAANDFMVGMPCDAFNMECPLLFGMNVMPGTFAVDNGTDTTRLTADVGMLGTDDGMADAVMADAVGGIAAGNGGTASDAVGAASNGDGAAAAADATLPKVTASAEGCRILPGDPLVIAWPWMTFGGVGMCNGCIIVVSIFSWNREAERKKTKI